MHNNVVKLKIPCINKNKKINVIKTKYVYLKINIKSNFTTPLLSP